MLLRIQRDESLRSYVERNLYVQLKGPAVEAFKELRYCFWTNEDVLSIANVLGWAGCYGFNKLVHFHTDYPWRGVFKSKYDYSYSGSKFLSGFYCFDDLRQNRSYCPKCVKEDIHKLGFSYWRRIHPRIKVCAKHNVSLLSKCPFCAESFSRNGHAVHAMWSGCAGRHLGDVEPAVNTDPMALRLAQFFEKLCLLEHHVSAETALRVLEERLSKLIDDGATAPEFSEKLAQLRSETEARGGHDGFEARAREKDLYNLFESIALVYEKFDEFLVDCHFYDPSPESIDSYWASYRIPDNWFEQFITEDYCLGVGIWSYSDPDISNPFHRIHWRDPQPRVYPCCNQTHLRRKGRQLKPVSVGKALPKVPFSEAPNGLQ